VSSRYLRDLLRLLDRCTYGDSYGVHGSDFVVCRICERESGAGVLAKPNWHADDCPVPRLQRKLNGKGQLPRGEHDHSQ
jgi:hypothetical protein